MAKTAKNLRVDAREMVPDLESLGMTTTSRRSMSSPASGRPPTGQPPLAAAAELARVIEDFRAEDLSAMVFARSHAAPAGYEAARSAIMRRTRSVRRALKGRVIVVEDFIETLNRIFKGAAVVDPGLVQELFAVRRTHDEDSGGDSGVRPAVRIILSTLTSRAVRMPSWRSE